MLKKNIKLIWLLVIVILLTINVIGFDNPFNYKTFGEIDIGVKCKTDIQPEYEPFVTRGIWFLMDTGDGEDDGGDVPDGAYKIKLKSGGEWKDWSGHIYVENQMEYVYGSYELSDYYTKNTYEFLNRLVLNIENDNKLGLVYEHGINKRCEKAKTYYKDIFEIRDFGMIGPGLQSSGLDSTKIAFLYHEVRICTPLTGCEFVTSHKPLCRYDKGEELTLVEKTELKNACELFDDECIKEFAFGEVIPDYCLVCPEDDNYEKFFTSCVCKNGFHKDEDGNKCVAD